MLIGGRSHGGAWPAEAELLRQTLCKSASGCCGLWPLWARAGQVVDVDEDAGGGERLDLASCLWTRSPIVVVVEKKGSEKLDD